VQLASSSAGRFHAIHLRRRRRQHIAGEAAVHVPLRRHARRRDLHPAQAVVALQLRVANHRDLRRLRNLVPARPVALRRVAAGDPSVEVNLIGRAQVALVREHEQRTRKPGLLDALPLFIRQGRQVDVLHPRAEVVAAAEVDQRSDGQSGARVRLHGGGGGGGSGAVAPLDEVVAEKADAAHLRKGSC
jgi:hypothetical protein